MEPADLVVNSGGVIQNKHAKKVSLHTDKGKQPALDTEGQENENKRYVDRRE